MKSTFIETLQSLANSGDREDKELLAIVQKSSENTQLALSYEATTNVKFQQYLALQQAIAQNAETYLTESRNAYQKFKSLIANPSKQGVKRILSGLTGGLWKPNMQHTPQTIGSTILDLYNAQVEHKGAVQTSHDILKNRRKLIYGIARDTAESLKDHSFAYVLVEKQLKKLTTLKKTLDTLIKEENGSIDELKKHLGICLESGLFDGAEIISRINEGDNVLPDLYVVREDVSLATTEFQDKYRGEGLEIKGAKTLLEGLDLQKSQFDQTVTAMHVQLQELDVDLRYTKDIARNTFYLAQGQGVSKDALDGFMMYKKIMNDVQRFNSLGARVMLDRVGSLLTNVFLEPEVLEESKDELNQGIKIFAEKEEQFHHNVQTLVEKLKIKGGYTTQFQGAFKR